ncbi:MAG: hypothetical protein AAB217_13140, partial [Chloroflexota bacterium]
IERDEAQAKHKGRGVGDNEGKGRIGVDWSELLKEVIESAGKDGEADGEVEEEHFWESILSGAAVRFAA